MKTGKIDFVTLSPILFLMLVPAGNLLSHYFTQTAARPEIALHKYFTIPFIGFSLSCIVLFGITRNEWTLSPSWNFFIEKNCRLIIFVVGCLAFFCFLTLSILRYTSFHTSQYDMGAYDRKIWLISIAPLSKIFYETAKGHFQPILVVHGFVYKMLNNALILQVLQSIATMSGIIPLYLIAQRYLCIRLLLIICLIYVMYPPIAFNASTEFHPDALYIPMMLWAFYFAEKGHFFKGITFAGIAAMSKEAFLLGVAFFGLYLSSEKKKHRIGIMTFMFFLFSFLAVIYIILPFTNQNPFFQGGTFPFFEKNNAGISTKIEMLINMLSMWKVRKLLFLYFLLFPLLFFPLLEWRRFLPALPLVAIPLLSTSYLHSAVDSQYTLGIFVPSFVAMIFSLKKIEDRKGLKYANAFAIFAFLMTITFHISHSASPFSVGFWRAGWAESWHNSNYVTGEQEKAIKEAISQIPQDPHKVVTSQGNINHARLAHRYDYRVFPEGWEHSDYILLSLRRALLMGDRISEEGFCRELEKVKSNPKFQLIFEQNEVLLFKKISGETKNNK